MSIERVIKKYPNRRLYDMVESRYITLSDVRRLVIGRIDFVITDKRDQADITRRSCCRLSPSRNAKEWSR